MLSSPLRGLDDDQTEGDLRRVRHLLAENSIPLPSEHGNGFISPVVGPSVHATAQYAQAADGTDVPLRNQAGASEHRLAI
jgi:hypothetical protein